MLEPAQHIGRILSAGDQAVYREFMLHFDNQVVKDQELSAEKKQELIRELITKVTDANGAIEVGKEQNGGFTPIQRAGQRICTLCGV